MYRAILPAQLAENMTLHHRELKHYIRMIFREYIRYPTHIG
jgi:hypothetical protein